MGYDIIHKTRDGRSVEPNLLDYEATRAAFSWESARQELSGLPDGTGLNIAYEAIDRHAAGDRRDHLAIRWLGRHGEVRDFTYGDLHEQTNRFANVLQKLGVGKGDRVFALAGRIPELYVAALGTLKNGSVFSPLFSAFGPEPIRQRLTMGQGKVLVTTESLYKMKVAGLRESLPDLEHVLVVGRDGRPVNLPGTLDLRADRYLGGAHRSFPFDRPPLGGVQLTAWTRGTGAFDRATIECTNVMSSASSARCGNRSETYLPDSPRGLNVHGDFITVPRFPKNGVIVFLPCVSCPWCRSSAGL